MKYIDEFPGQPHRMHNPMEPPSSIWLVGGTAAIAAIAIVVMIVGMAYA